MVSGTRFHIEKLPNFCMFIGKIGTPFQKIPVHASIFTFAIKDTISKRSNLTRKKKQMLTHSMWENLGSIIYWSENFSFPCSAT